MPSRASRRPASRTVAVASLGNRHAGTKLPPADLTTRTLDGGLLFANARIAPPPQAGRGQSAFIIFLSFICLMRQRLVRPHRTRHHRQSPSTASRWATSVLASFRMTGRHFNVVTETGTGRRHTPTRSGQATGRQPDEHSKCSKSGTRTMSRRSQATRRSQASFLPAAGSGRSWAFCISSHA